MFTPNFLRPLTSFLAISLSLGVAPSLLAQTDPETELVAPHPDEWVALNSAGIGFAVPQGFEIARDNIENNLLALEGQYQGASLRIDAQYRSHAEIVAQAAQLETDANDPLTFFSAYAGQEFTRVAGPDGSPYFAEVDGLRVTLLRSAEDATPQNVVFVAQYPDGGQAWVGATSPDMDATAMRTLEPALLQSLSFDVAAAPAMAEPQETATAPEVAPETPASEPTEEMGQPQTNELSLLDGLVTIELSPDAVLVDQRSRRLSLAHGSNANAGADPTPDTMFASFGMRDRPQQLEELLSEILDQVQSYQTTERDGVPVWQIDGMVSEGPNGRRAENGELQPARLIVTRLCQPEAGPVLLGVLLTNERLAQLDGDLDAAAAPARLHLAEGSAECRPEFDAVLQAALDAALSDAQAQADGVVSLMGDIFTTTLADGDAVLDQRERRSMSMTFVGPEGGDPNRMLVSQRFEAFDRRMRRQLSTALTEYDDVRLGMLGDVPVYVVDGAVNRGMDRERLPEGQTNPARIYLTQRCAPGQAPLTLAVLADRAYADAAGGLDALTMNLNAALPEGHVACPPEMDTFMSTLLEQVAAAQSDAPPPEAAPEAPAANADAPDTQTTPAPPAIGKTPSAPAHADAADWQAAQADGSIGALISFYLDWPGGHFAADARTALANLGVSVPATIPTFAPDHPELLAWQTAQASATPEAMWDYLKAMPQGFMASTAESWLDALLSREQRTRAAQEPSAPQPAPVPQRPLK